MWSSSITVLLLVSTLLSWGQTAPATSQGFPLPMFYNYNNHRQPLMQTVRNGVPAGFFYFPSFQSLMPHIEGDNLVRGAPNTNTRVKFTNTQEVEHRSPGYDGTSKYETEIEQVSFINCLSLTKSR